MKRCSALLTIREMQVETMRSPLTAVRTAVCTKVRGQCCWGEERNCVHCWGHKWAQLSWTAGRRVLRKLLLCASSPIPGVCQKEKKSLSWGDTIIPRSPQHCSQQPRGGHTQAPVDGWMETRNVVVDMPAASLWPRFAAHASHYTVITYSIYVMWHSVYVICKLTQCLCNYISIKLEKHYL